MRNMSNLETIYVSGFGEIFKSERYLFNRYRCAFPDVETEAAEFVERFDLCTQLPTVQDYVNLKAGDVLFVGHFSFVIKDYAMPGDAISNLILEYNNVLDDFRAMRSKRKEAKEKVIN